MGEGAFFRRSAEGGKIRCTNHTIGGREGGIHVRRAARSAAAWNGGIRTNTVAMTWVCRPPKARWRRPHPERFSRVAGQRLGRTRKEGKGGGASSVGLKGPPLAELNGVKDGVCLKEGEDVIRLRESRRRRWWCPLKEKASGGKGVEVEDDEVGFPPAEIKLKGDRRKPR